MSSPTPPKPTAFSTFPLLPKPPEHFRENELLSVLQHGDSQVLQHFAIRQVFDQNREEIRALHARNAAIEWKVERLRWYTWHGEMLRQMHLLRRQEQHCGRCGYRFNYKADGNLKHENDWCRSDKRYCDKSNGQQSCLDLQKAQEAANRREHRKALKSTNTKGQLKIALHPNGTTKHH
jgi:hypothetical protein